MVNKQLPYVVACPFPVVLYTDLQNNPSYTSMGVLIFLSVRSNTDQIRMKLRLVQPHLMCSRNRVFIYGKAEYRVMETSTSNFEWLFLSK